MDALLHFEDFRAGQSFDLGTYTVTAEEIVAFAREFDPQPQHLSDEEAKLTLLGGLAASGWHTCAIAMRMLVDGLFNRSTSLGGVGVDDCRWLKPVRPNDVLGMTASVVEVRPSSKGGRGYITFHCEMFRGAEKVLSFHAMPMLAMREG
jgi:acyl dehydratase